MGRIYFVRHGETVWNREKRIAGSTDVALTEKGREEAEERGKELEKLGLKVDRIYSSPLSRAYDTALIIASHLNVEVEKDERLREQDFGYWEGVAPGDRREDFIRDKMCFMKKYGDGESMLRQPIGYTPSSMRRGRRAETFWWWPTMGLLDFSTPISTR